VLDLGTLATGGEQLLGHIVSGHLYSEPGFSPQFSGSVQDANDYLTSDPGNDGIARPNCMITIVPDDGDTPFLLEIGGVDISSAASQAIFNSNVSLGRAVPYGSTYSSKFTGDKHKRTFFFF
jgi:hypothetical protein